MSKCWGLLERPRLDEKIHRRTWFGGPTDVPSPHFWDTLWWSCWGTGSREMIVPTRLVPLKLKPQIATQLHECSAILGQMIIRTKATYPSMFCIHSHLLFLTSPHMCKSPPHFFLGMWKKWGAIWIDFKDFLLTNISIASNQGGILIDRILNGVSAGNQHLSTSVCLSLSQVTLKIGAVLPAGPLHNGYITIKLMDKSTNSMAKMASSSQTVNVCHRVDQKNDPSRLS